ncbi:MAG: hypothetical protein HY709_07300 [Candidatus Latescibacteria bacterium]|nr:hypothetical protein [Candidatus Latescibacterota bacterium]
MKGIPLMPIAALLFQIGGVPVVAQEVVILKGDDIGRSRLNVGAYIEVTYYSTKGQKETANGYVEVIEDDTLTMGQGFWRERIAYRDIISLATSGLPIAPGARVRLTVPTVVGSRLSGTLVAWDVEKLVVQRGEGDSVLIARTAVTRLEVSRGRRSRDKEGAGIGFLVGASAGVILGVIIEKKFSFGVWGMEEERPRSGGHPRLVLGVVVGTLGAVVGAVVGSHKEKRRPSGVELSRSTVAASSSASQSQ